MVANRGEIAARVIRTCQRLGIQAVLAVSDADRDSLPARHAAAAGLPVLPGGLADGLADRALADVIGFPVLVKAAGGGGGRGLRVVGDPAELADAVSVASAEAGAAFGGARVYLE